MNYTDIEDMSMTFKSVFKILNTLDLFLDYDKVDIEQLSPKTLKLSESRWKHYILMLYNAEYIDGVDIRETINGDVNIDITDIKITLKGLEYLANNDTMRKVASVFAKTGLKVAEKLIPII